MTAPKTAEIEAERKKVRRLQFMMSMVMNCVGQNDAMPVEEASQKKTSARKETLNMFPGKDLAYDLIYRPRFQRLIQEKYGLQ